MPAHDARGGSTRWQGPRLEVRTWTTTQPPRLRFGWMASDRHRRPSDTDASLLRDEFVGHSPQRRSHGLWAGGRGAGGGVRRVRAGGARDLLSAAPSCAPACRSSARCSNGKRPIATVGSSAGPVHDIRDYLLRYLPTANISRGAAARCPDLREGSRLLPRGPRHSRLAMTSAFWPRPRTKCSTDMSSPAATVSPRSSRSADDASTGQAQGGSRRPQAQPPAAMRSRRNPAPRPNATMPVELTERAIRDALAVAEEWNVDGARSARAALEWMGWEGEGPLLLRRYDVQLFVWYTLPRKFLTTLEHKREAADALARTLEQIGGRAASYADTCRARETDALLCAWENEDPDAWRRFQELLEGSGLSRQTPSCSPGAGDGFRRGARARAGRDGARASDRGREAVARHAGVSAPPGGGRKPHAARAARRRRRVQPGRGSPRRAARAVARTGPHAGQRRAPRDPRADRQLVADPPSRDRPRRRPRRARAGALAARAWDGRDRTHANGSTQPRARARGRRALAEAGGTPRSTARPIGRPTWRCSTSSTTSSAA